jgi:putative ABC transport system ATP-binding protein
MTPILSARGIGKVFGEGELACRALHPLDFSVRAGEVRVIMGPSGSGKTTLLSILGLVLLPTEGEVCVRGVSTRGAGRDQLARLRREEIGFVFQQFNLLTGLTALENVEIPLLLGGIDAQERKARAYRALERVSLSERASSRARLLSGGQQQRVAIARALVADAPVLLCDEPTASLDGETGRAVLSLLRALAEDDGRAVVIVTHDPRVLSVADSLLVVEDGHSQERALPLTREVA